MTAPSNTPLTRDIRNAGLRILAVYNAAMDEAFFDLIEELFTIGNIRSVQDFAELCKHLGLATSWTDCTLEVMGGATWMTLADDIDGVAGGQLPILSPEEIARKRNIIARRMRRVA